MCPAQPVDGGRTVPGYSSTSAVCECGNEGWKEGLQQQHQTTGVHTHRNKGLRTHTRLLVTASVMAASCIVGRRYSQQAPQGSASSNHEKWCRCTCWGVRVRCNCRATQTRVVCGQDAKGGGGDGQTILYAQGPLTSILLLRLVLGCGGWGRGVEGGRAWGSLHMHTRGSAFSEGRGSGGMRRRGLSK